MQTSSVPKALSERFGNRMDSKFMLLVQKYLPVVDELIAAFSLLQLKSMALRLPVAAEGSVVLPSVQYPRANSRFDKRIIEARLKKVTSPDIVAVYVAVALDGLAKKMLLETEELEAKKAALIQQLWGLVDEVSAGKTPLSRELTLSDAKDLLPKKG